MAVKRTPKKALAFFERAKTFIRKGNTCQLPSDIKLDAGHLLNSIDALIEKAQTRNRTYEELKGECANA